MVPTVLDSIATSDAVTLDRATRASTPTARFPAVGSLLRKLAMTLAVWTLYVPHLAVLKVLGPRSGPSWARFVGRLHWLLTLFGAERLTRERISAVYPQLQTGTSVSTILRKHLELKHECFARIRAFSQQHKPDTSNDMIWDVDAKFRQRFEQARSSGRGLIIVGYHFGFFRVSASAIAQVFPGCDVVHVSHRIAHYEGETSDKVAHLALEKALRADQHSGTRIHYVEGSTSILPIVRLLRAGDIVALAADGAIAKDFLDLPFLGGMLRLPCGWARLAAATKSEVLVMADTEIDHYRRKACLFDRIHVDDGSAEAIYNAVAEAAAILEELVRREPWSWHPWRRLHEETAGDGTKIRSIKPLGPDHHKLGPDAVFRRTASGLDPNAITRSAATAQGNRCSKTQEAW